MRPFICVSLIAGLTSWTAFGQSAEELDKRERCAVRLSIALTGKTADAALLTAVDPQAQADMLIDSVDFIERYARFTNTSFNRNPGQVGEEDAPYYVAWEVLSQRKQWKQLFIGPYRVEKNASDSVVVVNDPDGLGYMRSPAWLKRYAGNERDGIKLSTAYRIFNNVIGLKLVPSTNAPDADISANGRQSAGCRACHYDGLFALDTAASVLTKRVGTGATMTFAAPSATGPVTMLGGVQVSDDKSLVTALVNSESFNFRTCRMAFQFLYGRSENQCEGPVFDRCMKEFRTQGTLQSAVATIAKDPSFCQ